MATMTMTSTPDPCGQASQVARCVATSAVRLIAVQPPRLGGVSHRKAAVDTRSTQVSMGHSGDSKHHSRTSMPRAL